MELNTGNCSKDFFGPLQGKKVQKLNDNDNTKPFVRFGIPTPPASSPVKKMTIATETVVPTYTLKKGDPFGLDTVNVSLL